MGNHLDDARIFCDELRINSTKVNKALDEAIQKVTDMREGVPVTGAELNSVVTALRECKDLNHHMLLKIDGHVPDKEPVPGIISGGVGYGNIPDADLGKSGPKEDAKKTTTRKS
jgi:hypothetical protein